MAIFILEREYFYNESKTVYSLRKKLTEIFYLFVMYVSISGGVIEACPPSDSITTLTVDMLIEPNGKTSLISCGDQIHAESQFSCWGVSIPQSSVEPDLLNKACFSIAESCKSRGIMGYFCVDFVTFIDPKSVSIDF